ncbi:MAG: hypothetical protein EXR44_08460 [Dehalococcoidia bacterium]|nr:hypothetical protein [Dehalococcoidia bacterium]
MNAHEFLRKALANHLVERQAQLEEAQQKCGAALEGLRGGYRANYHAWIQAMASDGGLKTSAEDLRVMIN